MSVEIVRVDYADNEQCKILIELLDNYAKDPMGGGKGLSEHSRNSLQSMLASAPNAFSLLIFVDGKAAGFTNCFQGYSTFAGAPLINIHDIAVNAGHRGKGLASALMAEIENIALERGCCKVTLEVLAGNTPAKSVYSRAGFAGGGLDPVMGHYEAWEKSLKNSS